MPYPRLHDDERETTSRGLSAGWTLARIAALINRDVSTVSREVKNNCRY